MSWIAESSLTWIQRLCVNIIKTGHIPHHVAFIMDGNRRYAKTAHVQNIVGHMKGFDKLAETLQWCKELGIKEVTVYAFSIENFKRSKEEVDALMTLAREKFEKLLEEKDKIMDNGLCIRIIGNLSHISPELRKLIAKVMFLTENNDKCFLNIAFAYSSRDEITNSIKSITHGVSSGDLKINDIDEQLMSNCMYTNKSPDPDLLVRTSGEFRFSDFLLWQISCTQVCFTGVLWPELSIWHLLTAIFQYQTRYNEMRSVKEAKTSLANNSMHCRSESRVANFLNHIDEYRRDRKSVV